MSYDPHDTICAIATAAGGAARGMVRVSGPHALSIVARLFQAGDGAPLDRLQQATAVTGRVWVGRTILSVSEPTDTIVRPTIDAWLPCDLFLWPTSRSYTRQPLAELHTIGSPPLLEALLVMVCRVGARMAEPGEFTLRAFLAGRLDLTQAEAVLGVIDAHGENELSAALAQLAGGLARPLHQLREELLQLLAELEAGLDFVDEDIKFVSSDQVRHRLKSASRLLGDVSCQMASRHTAGRAMQVALIGPPNVGKSSLFNAIVARRGVADASRRQRQSPALVAPERGTTRDYLTAIIDLDGIRCELVDTAGLDEQPSQLSAIDAAAQALAAERRTRAAIRACCVDASQNATRDKVDTSHCDIIVLTKADIATQTPRCMVDLPSFAPAIVTSSCTGDGLDELCATFRELLTAESPARHGQVVAATADRCRESIRLAEAALRRATNILSAEGGDELVAAELRTALSELGKVVGAVYTDDLLDRIFSTFCIGK